MRRTYAGIAVFLVVLLAIFLWVTQKPGPKPEPVTCQPGYTLKEGHCEPSR